MVYFGMANRLAHESSPYLLQHANNPVDWFPWGPEAFEKARREDKPLLISIGYSTCHWCHVMERECFENPTIAAVMNTHLVAVKVDREERPDVDRIYMTAVQAMTGQGGWPLNMFVTSEGKPFTGGTYFPPETRHGRRGWPEVVEAIGKAWKDPVARERLLAQGEGLTQATREFLNPTIAEAVHRPESVENCRRGLEQSFDPDGGGHSRSPKFPMPANQFFLFRYAAAVGGESGERAKRMALETLWGMSRGGIFDHVGGGFHRYSTDERWFLPHFEKMLYDNAQLAVNFLDAYQLTHVPIFAGVATKILDYLLRDLCHPNGGFYSAEDADSLPPGEKTTEKREGAFYVWDLAEVRSVLGEDSRLFSLRYGLTDQGNVENDPQREFTKKNVLFESLSLEEAAREVGMTPTEADRRLSEAQNKLWTVRAQRPRPHLDDKILTSWNGLALSAFAQASRVLGQERYLTAAQRVAAFLRKNLWDGERLYRRWRDNRRDIFALADDHAFLAQGLIDLYGADFDPAHLFWAEQLTDQLIKRFLDPTTGALFSTPADHDPLLLLRAREEGDNVEPSAASVAAFNLLRLSLLLGREDFRPVADRMMEAHLGSSGPTAFPVLNAAALLADAPPRELVLVGSPRAEGILGMLKVVRAKFLPELTVILLDGPDHPLAQRLPFLKEMRQVDGKPTAYFCHNFACQTPVTDPNDLMDLLKH